MQPKKSLRECGRESATLALQWHFRSDANWQSMCRRAMSVAILGMEQSNMRPDEIADWKRGFADGLGNLQGAELILNASTEA